MSEQTFQMQDDSGPVGQQATEFALALPAFIFLFQQHAFTDIDWTWNIKYHTSLHRYLCSIEGLNGSVPAD